MGASPIAIFALSSPSGDLKSTQSDDSALVDHDLEFVRRKHKSLERRSVPEYLLPNPSRYSPDIC
jgi:hypothetical protein